MHSSHFGLSKTRLTTWRLTRAFSCDKAGYVCNFATLQLQTDIDFLQLIIWTLIRASLRLCHFLHRETIASSCLKVATGLLLAVHLSAKSGPVVASQQQKSVGLPGRDAPAGLARETYDHRPHTTSVKASRPGGRQVVVQHSVHKLTPVSRPVWRRQPRWWPTLVNNPQSQRNHSTRRPMTVAGFAESRWHCTVV